MVNIQHATLNDIIEVAKLFMSIGTKGGLVQQDITRLIVTGCI